MIEKLPERLRRFVIDDDMIQGIPDDVNLILLYQKAALMEMSETLLKSGMNQVRAANIPFPRDNFPRLRDAADALIRRESRP